MTKPLAGTTASPAEPRCVVVADHDGENDADHDRRRCDLRRALDPAATDLLAAHGPDGVTLRGAARAAGVSQAAPYRHFDSKEALLAAVAAEGFQAMGRALAAAPAAEGSDPVQHLRALAVCYIRFVIENPAYYRLIRSGGELGCVSGVARGFAAPSSEV